MTPEQYGEIAADADAVRESVDEVIADLVRHAEACKAVRVRHEEESGSLDQLRLRGKEDAYRHAAQLVRRAVKP